MTWKPATIDEVKAILRSERFRRVAATLLNYVFEALAVLKWNLLILSDRIFDSNVDRLMPSFAAAPDRPDTRLRSYARQPQLSLSRGQQACELVSSGRSARSQGDAAKANSHPP